ncbi:TIGR00299 family protein [Xenococcus sp. PCC 7305]|uniref:nickel pincer cofactor biosynthesis protein LarC n=1 Tax=Xenococcus sp. PCC 7305 TaxID=102125 RepID=UPI0002ABA9F9|nr:nickel pincer cofactor biosynthesis protein LarC [Xenococcus sp. PCC 7305]ELS02797.1 TIGR00299 family protein [Xenococcus sp. PCC 7305]
MIKVAYLECPTGIAGDMFLGALVDVGVPWEYLQHHLANLGIEQEYQLEREQVHRQSQLATKVRVKLAHGTDPQGKHHHHHHAPARHLPEITSIIKAANLPNRVQDWSLQTFYQLAVAEAAVHGIPPEKVHFHEVGATDAIIDIVGTCLGLDWLDITELYCSPMPTGGGTVKAAHGILPVPVPATLKLWQLRNVPTYSNGINKELVTPTGAAIATTLAKSFGEPPAMTIEKIGLGAGTRDLEIPNILRLWIGKREKRRRENGGILGESKFAQETVMVLETQIDDLNPQAIAYTLEQLLAAGALDVFTQPVGMKKSRSGILLTVICFPEKAEICQEIIFRETTTLGIRKKTQTRSILDRQIKLVATKYGEVRVKIASWGKAEERQIINIQPEYEDCAKLAKKHHVPWREIYQQAISQYSL